MNIESRETRDKLSSVDNEFRSVFLPSTRGGHTILDLLLLPVFENLLKNVLDTSIGNRKFKKAQRPVLHHIHQSNPPKKFGR
jgi:hypothetical protein